MKKITLLFSLMLMISINSFAQSEVVNQDVLPQGTVMYSLPRTSVNLIVEAECENFTAGPYAKYAQKYLGIVARESDEISYTLKSIELVPYLEADYSTRASIILDKSAISSTFFKITNQGLVVLSDSYTGKNESWRFPTLNAEDPFAARGVNSNLTDATSTLYKRVKTETGFEQIPVQQRHVVEKTLEQRAQEAAENIFDLREKRKQIITGDTDATFSGEALGAAIDEITRLEAEYLSMFIGASVTSTQKMSFDVVPSAAVAKQFYVAFRLSDTQGLLPANNMSGRPIVLELVMDSKEEVSEASAEMEVVDPKLEKKLGQLVNYRIPAIATAKVIDGKDVLLQTRIPIYQLGKTETLPLEKILTK